MSFIRCARHLPVNRHLVSAIENLIAAHRAEIVAAPFNQGFHFRVGHVNRHVVDARFLRHRAPSLLDFGGRGTAGEQKSASVQGEVGHRAEIRGGHLGGRRLFLPIRLTHDSRAYAHATVFTTVSTSPV
jgi:hypothetical protein